VGTWKLVHQIERVDQDPWPGALAFAPDSRVLACIHTRQTILLIDVASGQKLAILESAEPGTIGSLQFNANGDELAVVIDNRAHIWKLDQMRSELARIDLDWNPTSSPMPVDAIDPPERVVVLGAD
jgi:WD40 repeat protein